MWTAVLIVLPGLFIGADVDDLVYVLAMEFEFR